MAYDSNHAKLWQDIKADLDKLRARAGRFAADAEWAFGSRTARVLGVLVLFAVVVTLLLVFLNWYVAPTKPSDKKDLVLALAQILAGTALLSGLYFTWRTLQVNRDQQVTERFTRAIDQLGATDDKGEKKLEIRLGGIYALERIARDSPDRDYSTIMEVLTAYVRANAARSEPKPTASEPTNQEPPTPSADIQAILTVLGRRTKAGQEGDVVLDLSMTDLRGARLEGAHLERAVLLRADLERARLERAHLEEANLRGANLKGAHLEEAHIEGTDLRPYIWWGADDITFYETAHLPLAEEFEDRLTQKQLEQAHGDEHTRLEGTGLERPAHWGAKTDKQSEGD